MLPNIYYFDANILNIKIYFIHHAIIHIFFIKKQNIPIFNTKQTSTIKFKKKLTKLLKKIKCSYKRSSSISVYRRTSSIWVYERTSFVWVIRLPYYSYGRSSSVWTYKPSFGRSSSISKNFCLRKKFFPKRNNDSYSIFSQLRKT